MGIQGCGYQHRKVLIKGESHQVWASGPGKDMSGESEVTNMTPFHYPDNEICRMGCS